MVAATYAYIYICIYVCICNVKENFKELHTFA